MARKMPFNPAQSGTKAAARYVKLVAPGESFVVQLRLTDAAPGNGKSLDGDFAKIFDQRRAEADEFYRAVIPEAVTPDRAAIMRQAAGGLLWSKQFYYYDVNRWLKGDPVCGS